MSSFCFKLLAVVVISSLVLICHGERFKFVVTNFKLPAPLNKHSAVYDGRDTIYIIGGYNEDRVTKFSVVDGTVEVIGTFMKVYNGAVVMDGDDLVYFGGYIAGQGRRSSGVYRFSTTFRNHSLVASLPVPIERLATAWDISGQTTYTFGGQGAANVDNVLRYRAAGDQIDEVARLPERRSGAAAVWDHRQGVAYLFGGEVRPRTMSRDIFRFNPSAASASVARVSATLPFVVESPCAVFANDNIYIVGDVGRIIKFDPRNERTEAVPVQGWTRRLTYSSCVHVPKQSRIYLIGGFGSFRQGEVTDRRSEIAYIDLGYPDSASASVDSGFAAKVPTNSNPNYVNKVIAGYVSVD